MSKGILRKQKAVGNSLRGLKEVFYVGGAVSKVVAPLFVSGSGCKPYNFRGARIPFLNILHDVENFFFIGDTHHADGGKVDVHLFTLLWLCFFSLLWTSMRWMSLFIIV